MKTYLLATLSILPVLVTKSGQATLLSYDALRLLEGVAHSASGDLGVFVEAVSVFHSIAYTKIYSGCFWRWLCSDMFKLVDGQSSEESSRARGEPLVDGKRQYSILTCLFMQKQKESKHT